MNSKKGSAVLDVMDEKLDYKFALLQQVMKINALGSGNIHFEHKPGFVLGDWGSAIDMLHDALSPFADKKFNSCISDCFKDMHKHGRVQRFYHDYYRVCLGLMQRKGLLLGVSTEESIK